MIGYKVTRSNRGSSMVDDHQVYRRVYRKGKVIEEVDGSLGLFIFKTRTAAVIWSAGMGDVNILMVSYNQSDVKPVPRYVAASVSYLNYYYSRRLGNQLQNSAEAAAVVLPPVATICVKKLKVLE